MQADALVRFGPSGGARIIRDAITGRMKDKDMAIPDDYKDAQGRLGSAPLNDLKALLKDNKEVGQFLEKLQKQRDGRIKGTQHEASERNLNRHLSEKREDFFIDLAERRPKDKKYLKGWVARARAYR